jgi:uncharacterized protein
MGTFSAYSLPIQGLKIGEHQFEYQLDQAFFSLFEESPIQDCDLTVYVDLDKRADMLVFEFEVVGWVQAVCDRCTAGIQLPVEGFHNLYVKYSEEMLEDDDEVVFILPDTPVFNIAKYLYEFSVLSLPLTNTYDCENDDPPPCNEDVLKVLRQSQTNDDNSEGGSLWDSLKDFKN